MGKFEKLLQTNIELKEKLELYKESVEKMNGILCIFNYNTFSVNWASENLERIAGYTQKELYKQNKKKLKALFHPDDFYLYDKSFNYFSNPETKDNSYTAIFRIKHKNGSYFWVHFTAFIIGRNPDGTPHKSGGVIINLDELMTKTFFEKLISERKKENNKAKLELLSKREKEILSFISKGLSTLQLAEKFKLSKRTIETHKRNMLKKLCINNSASLICFAINNGF